MRLQAVWARTPPPAPPARPTLELSGPKLALAFETLVSRSEDEGGVERYVEALALKSRLFADALADPLMLDLPTATLLCAQMPTVRRRVARYLEPLAVLALRAALADLLAQREHTASADERIAVFCACFPDDREHRFVRDLAAEVLHGVDPERYPLMTRWVWDARANTGVLREIWHGENVDGITIEVPDAVDTFVQLRQELAEYLTANGVFRDVLFYVDILQAQVYADYIGERGGTYLRTEFATPEDPMLHVRRILGLDGINDKGRSKLKSFDGKAEVVQ